MATSLGKTPAVIDRFHAYILSAKGQWLAHIPKKVALSSPPVILTEDHGMVVSSLEQLRFNNKIPSQNTAIHYDYHHDIYTKELPDSRIMYYRNPVTESEARRSFAFCSNFLISLISTGTIKDIVWVLPDFVRNIPNKEAEEQELGILLLDRSDKWRSHLIAEKVRLESVASLVEKEELHKADRTFKWTISLFDRWKTRFPDPNTPTIIDIDLDWFGVKNPIEHGYKDIPENVLMAMVDSIKYFRNIKAICIARESEHFALENNAESLLLAKLLEHGIIKLSGHR